MLSSKGVTNLMLSESSAAHSLDALGALCFSYSSRNQTSDYRDTCKSSVQELRMKHLLHWSSLIGKHGLIAVDYA